MHTCYLHSYAVAQWDSSTAVFSTNHIGKGSGTHTHLYVALISSAQNSAECCSEQSDTMQRDRSSAKYTELAHIYPLHHRHNHVTRPNTSPDKTAPIPYICNPECCPKSPSSLSPSALRARRRVFQRVPRFLVLNILWTVVSFLPTLMGLEKASRADSGKWGRRISAQWI